MWLTLWPGQQVLASEALRGACEASPPQTPARLLARLGQLEEQPGFVNRASLVSLEQLWCFFTQVTGSAASCMHEARACCSQLSRLRCIGQARSRLQKHVCTSACVAAWQLVDSWTSNVMHPAPAVALLLDSMYPERNVRSVATDLYLYT